MRTSDFTPTTLTSLAGDVRVVRDADGLLWHGEVREGDAWKRVGSATLSVTADCAIMVTLAALGLDEPEDDYTDSDWNNYADDLPF